ncbi:MAG: sel1 repeat family protein, partial [Oscillospiraceae bacterium]|nr:sel1 repeat family protein [Oscillospiraceae bacterium]
MVTGISFFMKNNVNTWLLEQFERGGKAYAFNCPSDFCFDMIDRAIRCHFVSSAAEISAKLFVRSELGMYDDFFTDMSLTVFADGRTPELYSSGRIDGDPEKLSTAFLKVGCMLRDMAAERNFVELYCGLNLESEGVLVKLIGNELRFDRVSGRKRPAMLCRTLFGGEQMVRPYQDEAYNLWGNTFVTMDTLLEDAKNGDEDAMERVAQAYRKGDSELQTEVDLEQAAYWFGRLAEQDNGSAQFALAVLYLQGSGVELNTQQALYWMERAKANGDENAFTYGDACKQIAVLRTAAYEGDFQAAAELAREYMNIGLDLQEDDGFFALSLQMAQQAAEADVPEAMWVLAQLYEIGLGVSEDFEQALCYYRKGCELGHSAC